LNKETCSSFYRPKVDAEEVENIKDVQRFYMVTSAKEKKKQKEIYRLFLIRQKQLPEIVEGNLLLKKKIGH
jgi:hypothetical protein